MTRGKKAIRPGKRTRVHTAQQRLAEAMTNAFGLGELADRWTIDLIKRNVANSPLLIQRIQAIYQTFGHLLAGPLMRINPENPPVCGVITLYLTPGADNRLAWTRFVRGLEIHSSEYEELWSLIRKLGALNTELWLLEDVARQPPREGGPDDRTILELIQRTNKARCEVKNEISAAWHGGDMLDPKIYR